MVHLLKGLLELGLLVKKTEALRLWQKCTCASDRSSSTACTPIM